MRHASVGCASANSPPTCSAIGSPTSVEKTAGGNGGKLGIEAWRHYFRSVHAFLARAESEDWVTRNVCDKVAKPTPTNTELAASEVVKLMPVGDVEKLFHANRNCRVVGRLAREAFGGVRCSTAGKITANLINYEQKGLGKCPGLCTRAANASSG